MNDDRWMKMTGPLYKGKPGLCPERWLFWKSRFSKVTDEVDEEVAKMAQQAVGEMERAEKVSAMDLSTGERDDDRMIFLPPFPHVLFARNSLLELAS